LELIDVHFFNQNVQIKSPSVVAPANKRRNPLSASRLRVGIPDIGPRRTRSNRIKQNASTEA
jgi:hypothetical protein